MKVQRLNVERMMSVKCKIKHAKKEELFLLIRKREIKVQKYNI